MLVHNYQSSILLREQNKLSYDQAALSLSFQDKLSNQKNEHDFIDEFYDLAWKIMSEFSK